jgi:hypothetical protein
MDKTRLLTAIGEVLEAEDAVRLAYVYGSRIRGEARKDSDVDVGVLLEDRADSGILLQLTKRLQQVVSEVDCKRLELTQHPVYLKSVVEEGEVVVERDDRERVAFEVRVMQRYQDDEARRRIYRQYYGEAFA